MALCESCGQKPATVFFKAVVNDKSAKMNLCEECAGQNGLFPPGFAMPGFAKGGFSLPEIIGSLTGPAQAAPMKPFKTTIRPTQSRCPKCQTTFASFKTSGFVGCSSCYEAFYPAMREIIKKIHGSTVHTGLRHAPEKTAAHAPAAKMDAEHLKIELAGLHKDLEAAVRKEAKELEKMG
ncbi:MAG: hypothetical protein HY747_10695 [Elusimicrobia bacterium]|nr:hypothetical protein [Elusimicrobiota bacterium]